MFALFVLGLLSALRLAAAATAVDIPFDSYIFNGGRANNLTVAVNVPSNSTDELYFHFQAPAGQEWAAFGFGSQMAGSLIFAIYAQTDGETIMVSPRLGTGHVLPQHTSNVTITTLPGTQIINGVFQVNAKCSGCRTWNGGSIDVTSTAQNMIWAVGPSSTSFTSNDINAALDQHGPDSMRTFSLSMQKAIGDAGVPNVLGISYSNQPASSSDSQRHWPIVAHGFVLIIAFLVVFPGGYLLLRLFEKVWLHMAVQSLGLVLVIIGVAGGIAISKSRQISPTLNSPHQVMGILTFVFTILAWIIGLVGHQMFKKTNERTIPTMVHRGFGPLAVLFGLINVGMGFNFAGNSKAAIPFYLVMLIVFTVIGGFTYLIKRRKMRQQAMNTPAARNFNEAIERVTEYPKIEHVHMQNLPPTVTPPQPTFPGNHKEGMI